MEFDTAAGCQQHDHLAGVEFNRTCRFFTLTVSIQWTDIAKKRERINARLTMSCKLQLILCNLFGGVSQDPMRMKLSHIQPFLSYICRIKLII